MNENELIKQLLSGEIDEREYETRSIYPKLSVGARVLAMDANNVPDQPGIIVYMRDSGLQVLVEFDHYVRGHSGDGKGKDGHCWWVELRNITITGS